MGKYGNLMEVSSNSRFCFLDIPVFVAKLKNMEIWRKRNISFASKLLYISMAGLLAGIVIPITVILGFYLLFVQELPPVESLENYSPPLSTQVYSADGELLAEFSGERRIWVSLQDLPQVLTDALISVEDKEFFDHWGINSIGIMRAALVNLKRGGIVQGGSSLTQQLARNLFLGNEKTLVRKIKEALTSIQLELKYSKEELLELYLNQNYLGRGNYGVEAASRFYFGHRAKDLKIEEAALLVGLFKAPEYYNPVLHPERAIKRRNLVFDAMAENEIITPRVADSLKNLDLNLILGKKGYIEAPYFVEFIRQYIENKYGEEMLYQRGLKIYTTLNLKYQHLADSILNSKIGVYQRSLENITHDDDSVYTKMVYDSTASDSVRVYKQIQGALVSMEPLTGYIRAMVGGRDFYESQFNRAVQALRQPGSAFKPFTYTVAIDNGYSPCDWIEDTPIVREMPDGSLWRPQNYDNTYKGKITLREALTHSRNVATIRLAEKVSLRQVVNYAHRMGISTPLYAVPSLPIGSCEVTLLDMVTAYSVFANLGVKVKPIWITRIEDKNGIVIEENKPSKEVVLSRKSAYIMLDMLRSVIRRGTGWGARARGFDWDAGGKTGTTNEFTDAWFVGFSPLLVTGVWVGFDDKTSLGEGKTGAAMALPIWADYMIATHKGKRRIGFEIPEGIVYADICSESHLLATKRCPETIREVFREEQKPVAYCSLSHRKQQQIPTSMERKPAVQKENEKPPTTNRQEKERSILGF